MAEVELPNLKELEEIKEKKFTRGVALVTSRLPTAMPLRPKGMTLQPVSVRTSSPCLRETMVSLTITSFVFARPIRITDAPSNSQVWIGRHPTGSSRLMVTTES